MVTVIKLSLALQCHSDFPKTLPVYRYFTSEEKKNVNDNESNIVSNDGTTPSVPVKQTENPAFSYSLSLFPSASLSLSLSLYIYIYIYIYL